MLEILTLAVLAVIVLILILVFKLLKHFFKIFALVVLVLIIISTVASYFIYQDVMDLKENFDKNDNLFILHQNDKLFTGLSLKFDEIDDDSKSYNYLSDEQVIQYNEYYLDDNYDAILGDNYKIFFISYGAFDDVEEIELDGDKISYEFALKILESNDPLELYDRANEEIKPRIFSLLLNQKNDDPLFLIMGIKDKNIKIYPKTITFKMINYIPMSFIKDKLSDVFNKLNDKIGDIL